MAKNGFPDLFKSAKQLTVWGLITFVAVVGGIYRF